jgi:WhiB family redox-sensing transcriptional regulator
VDEAEAVLAWLLKPNAGASISEILAELVNRPAWHADAACRGVGTATFFHVSVGGPAPTRDAKSLCESCPVTAECLSTALDDPTTVGVWAGTTARGRKAMRRAATPQQVPVRSQRRLAG